MLITPDHEGYVAESEHRVCAFHQKHLGEPLAGCICSSYYGLRPATPEERAENHKRSAVAVERACQRIREQLRLTP